MLLAFELITTLLLGFVLGRIWQIRQQILLAEHVDNRRRPVESGIMGQGSERSQATDYKSLMASDRQNNARPISPASAVRLSGRPAASPGRFHALHQSLHHVG